MAETMTTEAAAVPAHVPDHLVYQWQEMDFPEEYGRDPFGLYRKLAKENRPIFYTPQDIRSAKNGAWVVTNQELCRDVLQNPDPFTTSIRYGSDNASWPRTLVPLGIDPPEHLKYRALIAPLFAPKAIDRMEQKIRDLANELLDNFAKEGQVDFMHEFARVFPGVIFMQLMGLPLDMKEQFFDWEEKFFHEGTPEAQQQVGLEIARYLDKLIAEKRRNPADDMVSLLVGAEVDGKPIDDMIIQDFCFLLYIAGLDTVNGGLGHTFKWLAENPVEQQRLRENPDLIPEALEEILRVHSWINLSRVLSRDYEFHGVQMKAGERVIVLSSLASYDEKQFENPFEVDLTREVNPHMVFGGGAHRCAGSHLARRELRVAITEWLRRIPQFEITPGDTAPYFINGLLSLQKLPLSWDASKAI